MSKIEIPLILQEPGSSDCGPTCVQIVLNHFGIDRNIADIKSNITYVEAGTTIYDNGSLLLIEDLKVTAVTAHPLLFPGDVTKVSQTNEQLLNAFNSAPESANKKVILRTLTKFIDLGGQILIEIPALNHIRKTIDSGGLVIALVFGQALGLNEGGYHFVIVNGYDDERVFITNPLPESKKQSWFPVEKFLFALHSSTLVDLDNGTLLLISK